MPIVHPRRSQLTTDPAASEAALRGRREIAHPPPIRSLRFPFPSGKPTGGTSSIFLNPADGGRLDDPGPPVFSQRWGQGAKALPTQWTGRLHNTLKTSLRGYGSVEITQIARETFDLYRSIR